MRKQVNQSAATIDGVARKKHKNTLSHTTEIETHRMIIRDTKEPRTEGKNQTRKSHKKEKEISRRRIAIAPKKQKKNGLGGYRSAAQTAKKKKRRKKKSTSLNSTQRTNS